MQFDEGLGEGQPQPRSLGGLGLLGLDLFEGDSQAVKVLGVDSNAGILHRQADAVLFLLGPHADAAARGGELYRVRHQVEQDLLKRPGVGQDLRQVIVDIGEQHET